MPWYALACFSYTEEKIAEKIGEQAYVPKRIIWRKVRKRGIRSGREKRAYPLIPGYILVDMDLRDGIYDLLRNDRRVLGFVEFGGRPRTIRDSEIDYLKRKEAMGHYDETKDLLYKLIGGHFEVHDGALDGRKVKVLAIKNRDLLMEVDGLPYPVTVSIETFEKTRHSRIG